VALPSAPGYVGVYHAAAAFALGILGVDASVAAAFGLFSWAVDIISGDIIGTIGMISEGLTFTDLKKSGQMPDK
jgi:hypothetical protein